MAAQVDKEHSIVGIPYAAVGVPIWEGETFIGAVTVVSSNGLSHSYVCPRFGANCRLDP